VTPKPELRRLDATATDAPAPATTRDVVFADAAAPVATPVHRRDALPAGARIEGPAIVEQLDATTLVPPGATATVDPWLNLVIDVGSDQA
jgi:N-methylhydantoinase A